MQNQILKEKPAGAGFLNPDESGLPERNQKKETKLT